MAAALWDPEFLGYLGVLGTLSRNLKSPQAAAQNMKKAAFRVDARGFTPLGTKWGRGSGRSPSPGRLRKEAGRFIERVTVRL